MRAARQSLLPILLISVAAAQLACRDPEATPGPVSAAQAWMEGEWAGTRTDLEDGEAAPMTMRVESILGGAGLAEHVEVRASGGSYHGFAALAYDPRLRRWTRQYVNAERGTFVRLDAAIEGERSIWTAPEAADGRRSRLVVERLAPRRMTRTQSVSEDGGRTWTTVWIDALERRGDMATAGASGDGQ